VTRREYLEESRQELQQRKEAVIAGTRGVIHVRTAGEQEAERQQTLEHLRNTYAGAELQTRIRIYLGNYKKDEDYMDQAIGANTGALNRTIGLIDSLLRNCTVQQLSLPAVVSQPVVVSEPSIVSEPADEFRGFGDGQAGSVALVRLRPAYFTGDGGAERLQSLLVCWRYHPLDAGSAGAASTEARAAGTGLEMNGFDVSRLRPALHELPE
jgi:hypothetical protein